MSVRKRTWTGHGVQKEAWIVTYFDTKGVKRQKTFARKRDADSFASKTHMEVQEGVHIADRDSITVKEAGKLWITTGEGEVRISGDREHGFHRIVSTDFAGS
ncbi:hypothetical protein SF83666_c28940 [Sinorhizobium fredii CCBAU 83666]|uniref:hypothetical protein n=1 Tax=Rhizobium fredii TaxID=380 RepID=UPI000BACD4E3|nr:hypothetical protein [Sinorhizobium fredii]ASY70301.1 hypothetical protein SF83666_c28940 [Sinorhizobium fredii CCBAU 83666]